MIDVIEGTNHITGTAFRLVYDDKKMIAVIEGTDKSVTSTNHKVIEIKLEQDILPWVEKEKLEHGNVFDTLNDDDEFDTLNSEDEEP